MDCKYVRENLCISFKFHPHSTSLFSLVHYKNRLRITQENLYTGLLVNFFPVPLQLQNLEVDNYILTYNPTLDLIILTLSYYVVIYSVGKKSLMMVSEAQGKNPYYIIKTCTKGKFLYFSCTGQRNVYSINLEECMRNGSIAGYIKYKISAEVDVLGLALYDRALVALCSDSVVRTWDVESGSSLRGVAIEAVGVPSCLSFSKDGRYLLVGTCDGYLQVWDGKSLGIKNTQIMSQKVANSKVQSLCWFHYSGQLQSHRFLTLTHDGNIKLYEFRLQKNHEVYIGRCSQISLLYIHKNKVEEDYRIDSHPFANFIFFNPGILLYMVDMYPTLYYPVVVRSKTYSFDELTPNENKQIFYQRDYVFMEGLQIKRLTDKCQHKLSFQNDLQYKELKILKLDIRPLTIKPSQKSKLMLLYYLKSCVRVLTISNIDLNQSYDSISSYKEYSGSWIMFVGPQSSYNSFIFIVQEDRQTITILGESVLSKDELEAVESNEQRRYLEMGRGEIYTRKINIKVDKVYSTPFRNSYVVLYQCENFLRFSNNISYDSEMISYEVHTPYNLRLDYTDIIIDVRWTSKGELGAVICLDKVVFINCELKMMRCVNITGYVIQGQWVGYTLMITTKMDVQYVDILSKPLQAYCIENFQTTKYLVLGMLGDRILGVEKVKGKINYKSRYFNLMEPLVAGYLNYQKVIESPNDPTLIKKIIECFAPYFIVSEEFIHLLNQNNLTNFSLFFLEGNEKVYSRTIRANTLNQCRKLERFIQTSIWVKNKKILLDLFLSYEEAKDSSDPYQKDKMHEYEKRIKSIVGDIAFNSISMICNQSQYNEASLTITNNFGEKALTQAFFDYKEGELVKMQIEPFKAENIGEWMGQFGNYIQSKPLFTDDGPIPQSLAKSALEDKEEDDEQDENEFRDLVLYWRIDQGKGQHIEDLSDYANEGHIEHEEAWNPLEEEPMELEDKWGKKCPPQYSLGCQIILDKKLNSKKFNKGLSVEVWIKPFSQSFHIITMQSVFSLSLKENRFIVEMQDKSKVQLNQTGENCQVSIGNWTHLAITFSSTEKKCKIFLNSQEAFCGSAEKLNIKPPSSTLIGMDGGDLELTQIRIWRKEIQNQDIKENMRMPLQIVASKKRKLKMKLRGQKKKENKEKSLNPFAFSL